MERPFLIGCCYYPEHWREEDMQTDLAKIRDLGFNCIRMGEFSWSMYEPLEGEYDFSLLTEAVRCAEKLGLFVILGTPTAAPPRWLTDKYPEVLCTNFSGVVMEHGSRQHHNHTSEIYLKYCAAITEAMVRHFSGCKNVIGWQIDNELNCHRNESRSDADDAAFRLWLQEKYGTVEKLNEAWGNRFWSLEFGDFSEITCPRPHPAHANPTWMTDYYLFLSDAAIGYTALQTKIIRRYMPDAFITHNGYFENIDYRKLTDECLDIFAFDSYPSFRERNGKFLGRNVAYQLALTRGCSEQFLILEQQSGPGGQLSYLLPTPRPGQIRLWTYQSIAHGAVGVLYFRYRTALYGAEQLWYGIYDHDGEENYRSREIRETAEEIRRLGPLLLTERKRCDVAVYQDYHNKCADKAESFAGDDAQAIFLRLNRENIHADFVNASDDFSRYKAIIVPHITVADEALAEKLRRFADGGGIVILSARSGVKDQNAHYRPVTPPGVFRDLAGCRVGWFTTVSAHEKQYVEYDGRQYLAETYCELLEPEHGETVGVYTEDFCKGKAGIVKNGNVYYLGFYCRESAALYADILRRHIRFPAPIDPQLEEIPLGGYRMYLNHGDYAIPLCGHDLLREEDFTSVPPYGAVLTKENVDDR